MLNISLEFVYNPNADLLLRFVFERLALDTLWNFESSTCTTFGDRELYQDLGCNVRIWEIRPDFHIELEFVLVEFFDKGVESEWSCIVTVDAVVHY